MKNKELFDKSIGILVKAFQEGTLFHKNTCACAIGNLIASNNNYKLMINDSNKPSAWINSHGFTFLPKWIRIHSFGQRIYQSNTFLFNHIDAIKELESTGYSIDETCLIEDAFEKGDFLDDDGYKGLMNVVDCLLKIHEMDVPESEVIEIKELFHKV